MRGRKKEDHFHFAPAAASHARIRAPLHRASQPPLVRSLSWKEEGKKKSPPFRGHLLVTNGMASA